MADDSNAVANEAIQLMGGNQSRVQGQWPGFDNSANGKALQLIYMPTVRTVARQFGWDFARNLVALTLSGNPAPFPFTGGFEYLYPGNGVQVWQLMPAALDDPFNPLPVNWSIGNTLVNGVQTKVIWSPLASARAAYNNSPTEATWDPLFRESVVRLLASVLSTATAGKPDLAQSFLDSGAAFESLGEKRTD